MPQDKVVLNSSHPITFKNGTPTPYFNNQLIKIAVAVPIIGTGSPEGMLEAPVYSSYIDESVPTVPVQYRKMLPHIGGDKSKGWIQL